jgi:hypothetical protein
MWLTAKLRVAVLKLDLSVVLALELSLLVVPEEFPSACRYCSEFRC